MGIRGDRLSAAGRPDPGDEHGRITTIFWDFDGVIKDSVEIKTLAFGRLFQQFGAGVAERVKEHHERNGGMSRFEKMPLYLGWAGLDATEERQKQYCGEFSRLVLQAVVEAPWVPGAETFIRSNPRGQTFVLISATPLKELESILRVLDLSACFAEVFGAPTRKDAAIRQVLSNRALDPRECLVIGDARADLEAARANRVPFLLRRHRSNRVLFADYTGPAVEDFTAL